MMMKKSMAGMKGAAGRPLLIAQAAPAKGRPSNPGLGRPSNPGLGPIGTQLNSQGRRPSLSLGPPQRAERAPPQGLYQNSGGSQNVPLQPQEQERAPPQGVAGPGLLQDLGKGLYRKGGKVKSKKMMDGGMAYSKGGSASSRADGVARKGKTKGKMMRYGGTC